MPTWERENSINKKILGNWFGPGGPWNGDSDRYTLHLIEITGDEGENDVGAVVTCSKNGGAGVDVTFTNGEMGVVGSNELAQEQAIARVVTALA